MSDYNYTKWSSDTTLRLSGLDANLYMIDYTYIASW